MSAETIVTICAAVYVLGLPVSAYVAGRLGGSQALAGLCLMWPVATLLAAIFCPLIWLSDLGEKHAHLARRNRR